MISFQKNSDFFDFHGSGKAFSDLTTYLDIDKKIWNRNKKKYGILGFWKVGSCDEKSMFDALLLSTSFYADTFVYVILHYFTLTPLIPLLPSSATVASGHAILPPHVAMHSQLNPFPMVKRASGNVT